MRMPDSVICCPHLQTEYAEWDLTSTMTEILSLLTHKMIMLHKDSFFVLKHVRRRAVLIFTVLQLRTPLTDGRVLTVMIIPPVPTERWSVIHP